MLLPNCEFSFSIKATLQVCKWLCWNNCMNEVVFWRPFFSNTIMVSHDQKKILWLEIYLETFRYPSQNLLFLETHWACWNRGSNIFKLPLFTLKSWPRHVSRTTKVLHHIHQLYPPLLNSHCYGFEWMFLQHTFYTLMGFLLNAVLDPILKIDTISKSVMFYIYSLFPSF